MKLNRSAWVLTAVFLSACGGLFGPEEERHLGVIAYHGDPAVVEVPDTVRAGEPFQVSVRTYGGGCISKGDTEVEISGLRVDVVPYDIHSGEQICNRDLALFEHHATVTIAEPGLAEVRIRGKEKPADTELVVTREVVVE